MKKSISLMLSVIMILFTMQTAFPVFALEGENPLKEMSFSQTEITLNTDSYGKKSADLSNLLVLTGENGEEKATYDALEWTSSSNEIASVDDNGIVTAASDGKCTVTVKQVINGEESSSYGLEASLNVTVRDSIGKFYNDIETTKDLLPADYTDKEKYLPAAVDTVDAVLQELAESTELEDTPENCTKLEDLNKKLSTAVEALLKSELVKADDVTFYDKWNEAYANIPEDLDETGMYDADLVENIKSLIDKVLTPETPWLNTEEDKAEIDSLASQLTASLSGLKRLKNPLSEISFSQTEITLNTDDFGVKTNDLSALLILKGKFDEGEVTYDGLKWTSEIEDVVTVDQNGVVTAVSNGKSEITVTQIINTDSGETEGLAATLSVTVRDSIGKFYNEIEKTKALLPADYTDKEKYLPAAVDSLSAVLEEIKSAAELDDTVENCQKLDELNQKLAEAYNILIGSELVQAGDEVFYSKWNEAYEKVPENLYSPGVYFESDVETLKTIIDSVTAPETPWLKNETDKAKIDSLAQELSSALTNLRKHTQNISLDRNTLSKLVGSSFELTAEVDGDDEIVWTTDNDHAVQIVSNGNKATVNVVGGCDDPESPYVTITATSNGKSDTLNLRVDNYLYDIKLEENQIIYNGYSLKIEYDLVGKDSTKPVVGEYTATYVSSDPDMVSVDSDGTAHAKDLGECTITVTCGAVERTVYLTVRTAKLVEQLVPVNIPTSVIANHTVKAQINVLPTDANFKDIEWKSSDEDIATVKSLGTDTSGVASVEIKGLKEGQTTITYKTTDKSEIEGSFTIEVYPQVSSIAFNKEMILTYIGSSETLTLQTTIRPENAGNKELVWESSNEEVATVDNGVITVKAVGICDITATATDGSEIYATCNLKVVGATVGMTLSSTSEKLKIGDTLHLSCDVLTGETSYKANLWRSSAPEIVEVDANGNITAHKLGAATITAIALDGTEAECVVTVREGIDKLYEAIEEKRNSLPSDYKVDGTYLPSAVITVDTVLTKIDEIGKLEDNLENYTTVWNLLSELTSACNVLADSKIVKPDDTEFYDKWNEAYSKLPDDVFDEGMYDENSVNSLENIINKVQNPETPWLKNAENKVEIDTLANELTNVLENIQRLKNPLKGISFSATDITLNTDEFGTNSKDLSGLLVLTGKYGDEDIDFDGLKWTTDREDIATVDDNGTITAVANGNCILTVSQIIKSEEGETYGLSATLNVTVRDSINKLYSLIETLKAQIPSDYADEGEYLPTAVSAVKTALDKLEDAKELEDTAENYAGLSEIYSELNAAYASLMNSELIKPDDEVFYDKWNEAYSKLPDDVFDKGMYDESSVNSLKNIIEKVQNPETPWLKTDSDKEKIDSLADELTGVLENIQRLRNPIKEMSFSQTEITLNTDDFGTKSKDISGLLVLTGKYEGEATCDGLEWLSTNDEIATVDKNGVVTAVSNGECVIRVYETLKDGGNSGIWTNCTIIVRDSISKLYNSIDATKDSLPSDRLDKEKYLPAAVDELEAALKKISETGILEDTPENYEIISALLSDLIKSYATLMDSVLVKADDSEFYDKWNEAYEKASQDQYQDLFIPGVYDETSVETLLDIINKVLAPETPWLKNETDKAKIDKLAKEFEDCLANIKKHTQNISLDITYALKLVGSSIDLTAKIDGEDDITWSTDNDYAVQIVGSGNKVTVKVVGGCDDPRSPYVTITATSNGKSASCRLTVDNYLCDINVPDSMTVYLGRPDYLKYEAVGKDPNKPVTGTLSIPCSSSNDKIATIDSASGLITPKSEGTCKITLEYYGIKKEVNLKVIETKIVDKFIGQNLPTHITVNATSIASVKVWPLNASIRDVAWTSSDPNTVTVESLGTDNSGTATAKLKGLKEGTAVITYSATDGSGVKGSYTVTVDPLVSSISLNKNDLLVYIGDEDVPTLKADIKPTNAGNQVLIWESSNENIAEVTNGVIKLKTVGTCDIIASTTDGTGLFASCKLTVVGDTQSMALNKTTAKLKVGEKLQLNCDVVTNTQSYKANIWSSSNTAVATVNANGTVTAVKPGTVTITAQALDGTKEECTITVTADLKGIKLPTSLTLAVGKEKTVTVTYEPSYATNKKVTWRSSDTSVAIVDTSGIVYAAGTGTATITAVSQEGGFIATCKVTVVRPVTSVSVNKTSYTLTMGKTESVKLSATVKPSNATLKTVKWSSSNQKVAQVSSTGIVTAVGPGTANITVTTNDGGYKATCKITVKQPLKGLKFKNSKETFYVGKEASLQMVYTPSNASNKTCKWKSSNKKVATVDSKGVITAVATGTCTITATSNDGNYKATCKLTVVKKVYPKSVKLNKTSESLKAGSTLQLKATISPDNASIKSVKWSSSDKDIATVNSKGLVTAKKGGTVTITCKTSSAGKKATCKITVTEKVKKITLSASSMTLVSGKSKTLTASVSPSSATNKKIKWYSGDKNIATVDKNGKVKAVKAGTVYITAKAKDGSNVLARCKVTIIQAPTKIKLNLDEASIKRGSKMTLTATVSPSNSYDKTVTWSSNKTSVAKVSSNGVVTAVSAGTATITCKSNVNDSVKGVCIITVEEPVRGINLDADKMTLTTGKTKTLSYTIVPSYATNKKVTYKTSDSDVVKVSKKGVVEAVGPGTATVTIRTNDGYFVDKCTITVIEPVISIKLSKTSFTLEIAESKTIKATIKPSNATNKDVTWKSSNSMIARVSQSGKVTALKPGKVTITCTSEDGVKATCTVTCVIGVEAVELNKTSITLSKGKTKTLKATIEPSNATIKDVKWSSSDKSIATVDKNGKVKAIKKGTVTITCKTKQGGYKATCKVKVK